MSPTTVALNPHGYDLATSRENRRADIVQGGLPASAASSSADGSPQWASPGSNREALLNATAAAKRVAEQEAGVRARDSLALT
jgi:hypothetical protein